MNQLTALLENGKSEAQISANWLQTSVQDFFSSINWEMAPVEVQQFKRESLQASPELTSLTLSVARFFSCIPWEGQPVIAPSFAESENLEIEQEESEDLTLDDFSSLF